MKTVAAALALLLLYGCGALKAVVSPAPNMYSLADARDTIAPAPGRANTALTLTVSPPHAAAGFDSPRMMYLRKAGQLEYFAHNEWVDTPARMLAPLIVAAVEHGGAFRAVVQTPSAAAGDLRLDTEIISLQQDFLVAPSQLRFTLRAYVVESATRRVIATREFEASVPAASENPQGGAVAANAAVRAVLEKLAAFCAEAARGVATATAGDPTPAPSIPSAAGKTDGVPIPRDRFRERPQGRL
jgi:cholesterol transport system auxiliary component